MSDSSDKKGTRKAGKKATSTMEGAKAAFLDSDLYKNNLAMALGIQGDPFTRDPERESQMFMANLGNVAKGQFGELMHKIGQTRGGAAAAGGAELATGTAQAAAQGLNQIMVEAAKSRVEDQARAMAIAQGLQNQQFSFDKDIAQTALGQGQLLASIAGIPSGAAQLGQGIGSLGSAFLGGSGFGNIVK